MTRERTLELFETLGTVFWFLMDGFWMLGWPITAGVLIGPAIITNLAAIFYIERSDGSVWATLAVNSWLWMNIHWMAADLYSLNITIIYAKVFFWAGVVLLLIGLIKYRDYKQYVFVVFYRFRRFRFKRNGSADKVN